MTEKAKIPQKVADAIEKIREVHTNYGVVQMLENGRLINQELLNSVGVLRIWTHEEEGDGRNADRLLDVLVNGYEIEPKFKLGDWVVHDSEQGAEVVREIRRSVVETNKRSHFYYRFRYATPEEIAEEKEKSLWKSIGREVGEFKSGDVIEYKSGYIRKVKRSGFHNLSVFVLASTAKKHYLNGEIARFYPEDSALDFDGGDE